MIKVQLVGFVTEPESERIIDDNKGWVVWRSLELIDTSNKSQIAEWFYVAACNRYFYDNVALKEGDGHGYYIQDKFDENELLKSVLADFEELSFETWDDFYIKMSKKFIYEDEELLED